MERFKTAISDYQKSLATTPANAKTARLNEIERTLLAQLEPQQKTAWEQLIGRSIGTVMAEVTAPKIEAPSTTVPTVPQPMTEKQNRSSTEQRTCCPTVKTPEVKPTGDKKLRFSFKFQPWRDVIEWFATQSDLSLFMDDAPPGTFNYNDPKYYTPAEALDLLNGVLQTKGYMLIRRERMLMVVNVANGNHRVLSRISPLINWNKRSQYELVSCLFKLEKYTPDRVATEIKPLLGPQGTTVILNEAKQLLVTDTAGRLRTVRSVIDSMERPANGGSDDFKPLALKNVLPNDAMNMVRQLMNIRRIVMRHWMEVCESLSILRISHCSSPGNQK